MDYVIYVIRGGARGWFVAPLGSQQSYTEKLQHARVYKTRGEAERDRCGNEKVEAIEDASRAFGVLMATRTRGRCGPRRENK